MASTAYPIAQSGSFTVYDAGTGINFETVQLVHTTPVHDTTGTGDAEKKSVSGITTGEVVAIGHLEASGDEGLAEAGILSGVTTIHCRQWTLRKAWPLFDVTGSSSGAKDSIKQWRHGLPLSTGSVVGVAKAGLGAQLDYTGELKTFTANFNIDKLGTLAGVVNILQKQIQPSYRDGGPVGAAMSFQFSEAATTWTPTSSNFTWLFVSGTANALKGDPPRGTLTIDLDTSTNVVENAICYDVTVSNPSSIGGRIPCQARFRLD